MSDASLAIIENSREKDSILAVWNKKYNCYTLPGGKHEPSDLSSTGAMMREVFEESQLTVTISQLVHEDIVDVAGEGKGSEQGRVRVYTHWAIRYESNAHAESHKPHIDKWDPNRPYQLVWISKRDFLQQTPWPQYTAGAFINLDNHKLAA